MKNHTKKQQMENKDGGLLNEEITFEIQKHKQNLWKEHLDGWSVTWGVRSTGGKFDFKGTI